MSVLIDYLATTAVDPDLLAELLSDPERALRAAGIDPAELIGPDPKPEPPEEPLMVSTVTPF
jgi:hypothetical protein